jgi:homoserine O-succinyltransferase
MLEEYKDQMITARDKGLPPPELPEPLIVDYLDNTWHDTAEAVLNNWIGNVYQITNNDRRLPFMGDIDPNDPLGLRR